MGCKPTSGTTKSDEEMVTISEVPQPLKDASLPKATEEQDDDSKEMARLILPNGVEHKLKIHRGTLGGDIAFLDIGDLYAKANAFTFDPGFSCTASCSSAITYIDGPAGKCLYRGYPVAELCKKCDYVEVAHLLLNGELPSREDKKAFVSSIEAEMMVHEKFRDFFKSFQMNAHPMAIMVAAAGALANFHQEQVDWTEERNRLDVATRVIAKMPTLAAMCYKSHKGEPFVYPKAGVSYAENFLQMMFTTPTREYQANPIHVRAIDRFLTIHADHEQNASTSTVRIAGSSQANPFVCIAAGVACLWGPAHGGANEAVLKMLSTIGTKENIPQFISDVKAKKAGVRLMGFGHRVYKNYDPRATYMRELCHEVFRDLRVVNPKLELAMELERIALSDEYFVQRRLYPNVDFYSGLVLQAVGIPVEMFTVMFALGRSLGWITHWLEMVGSGQMRIGRPRQLYTGELERKVPPMEGRLRMHSEASDGPEASRSVFSIVPPKNS
eukprot:CAMPEP_0175445372 /NCGR_PEP_ID=MMETSP0095-20121207/59713_1 /TAXON_ID=311494 /ORGANISM="Alexandrium monilatum, Strain CCMP3105" /LENGTH=497 /DNA_ID=CAMNT_0016745597 /DNA_START=15 /DNA_END=1505 /DNA_ORIENTATION=-